MSCDMKGTQSVYLDVAEYERIRLTNQVPETWCTDVSGYWVQIVPAIVYELEYRGLLDSEEEMSTYISWVLTPSQASGKL